ncbi:cupredoxin domain-containing protein [Cetobacterium sp.]|uniref:cupredoxin domain-containing protein n=2 Tax=Cetobacterium sp. TaxID=2071632 RepID=UPI002FC94B66
MKSSKIIGLCFLLSGLVFGKEIKIEAYNWGYEPKEVILKKDEPVKLTLVSREGEHGLGSKDLKFDLQATPEKPESVEITPTKSGEFTAKCTVPCGKGHKKMNVKIIVK